MTTSAAALLVSSLMALTGCCGGRRPAPAADASGDDDAARDAPATRGEPPLQRMQRECANGEQAECFALGKAHRDGTGTVKDLAQARTAFSRACDLRSGRGCEEIALLEATSNGGLRDLDAATRHYRAGCEYDAGVCWNAAEFVEMQAWAACGPQLVRYDRSKVSVRAPTLEQGSYHETQYWSTPERWEAHVREPLFDRPRLEVTHYDKRTWTTSKELHERYAFVGIPVSNESCAPVKVSASAQLHLELGDWATRAALGGLGTLLCAATTDKDPRCKQVVSASLQPLEASTVSTVEAGKSEVVTIRVDTQSILGKNRKIRAFEISGLTADGPGDGLCRPACLESLVHLTGEHASVSAMYERSCGTNPGALSCLYWRTVRGDHDRSVLQRTCNGGVAPNVEAACARLKWNQWLPMGAEPAEPATTRRPGATQREERELPEVVRRDARGGGAALGGACGECMEGSCLDGVCALGRLVATERCRKAPGCRVRPVAARVDQAGEIKCYVEPGQELLFLGEEGAWRRIVAPRGCQGSVGYIHSDVVAPQGE